MKRFLPILAAVVAPACTSLRQHEEAETAPSGPPALSQTATAQALAGTVDFAQHLKPILAARCLPCHNQKAMPHLFSMESREAVFSSGPLGPRIVPGEPEKSLLFLNPRGTHSAVKVMPPVGNRLTKDEVAILRRWIAQGAHWPAGTAGKIRLEATDS